MQGQKKKYCAACTSTPPKNNSPLRNAHTDEERLRRVAQHHRKNPGVGEVARGGDGAKAEEQENADRPHGEAYFWFVFV